MICGNGGTNRQARSKKKKKSTLRSNKTYLQRVVFHLAFCVLIKGMAAAGMSHRDVTGEKDGERLEAAIALFSKIFCLINYLTFEVKIDLLFSKVMEVHSSKASTLSHFMVSYFSFSDV